MCKHFLQMCFHKIPLEQKTGYLFNNELKKASQLLQGSQVLAPSLTEKYKNYLHNRSGISNEMKITENNFINYVSKVATKEQKIKRKNLNMTYFNSLKARSQTGR